MPNTIKLKQKQFSINKIKVKKIKTEEEYGSICAAMDLMIDKSTLLGDTELLSDADKNKCVRLSAMVPKWEKKIIHTLYL